jgi:hypothetical protein
MNPRPEKPLPDWYRTADNEVGVDLPEPGELKQYRRRIQWWTLKRAMGAFMEAYAHAYCVCVCVCVCV